MKLDEVSYDDLRKSNLPILGIDILKFDGYNLSINAYNTKLGIDYTNVVSSADSMLDHLEILTDDSENVIAWGYIDLSSHSNS